MPNRNGYIGRAPGDSAVTVARQSFAPTGVTTDFTFASGYTPGYFDLFINGVKMIEGSDYTSTDGSTFVVLNGGAQNGDVLEGIAYKAFNAASVTNANGNFTVGGDLIVSGIATLGAGTSVSFATTAYALEGTPDLTIRNLTGVAATFSGVVTYEDVTNIDSVGIITAQSDVSIADKIIHTGDTDTAIRFPAANTFTVETAGSERLRVNSDGFVGVKTSSVLAPLHVYDATNNTMARLESGDATCRLQLKDNTGEGYVLATGDNLIFANTSSVTERMRITEIGEVRVGSAFSVGQAGIVTATSFEGSGANLTNLPASGDSNDITACLFI